MAERLYSTFNYPDAEEGSKTLLTGIRAVEGSATDVIISGFYEPPTDTDEPIISFVYEGCVHGHGTFYSLDYPSSDGVTVTATNLYGPNNGDNGTIHVVGNYTTAESGTSTIGCLYEGPIDGSGQWTTIVPSPLSSSPILNVICHSNMGELVVGNYDTILIQGQAFIYDMNTGQYYNIVKPGAKSITAYGIWHDTNTENNRGLDRYTICGGYSNLDPQSGIDSGYIVDWDNKHKRFSNWREYSYDNNPVNSIITHFDGITGDGRGGFYLTGDAVDISNKALAFFAHVKAKNRYTNKATWSQIEFPDSIGNSGNSVLRDIVIGVYATSADDTINGYVSF